jgi:HTH-type transcriptional regulator / antitoxin HigA
MKIHPVRNDADHKAALQEIDRLWDAEDGTPEADMMEVLAILVEDYESKRWPVTASSPLEILQYAVSEMGHTQSGLAALLGSRSSASEILKGKRPLTIEAVRKIRAAWNIPAELLIAPYEMETAA